MEISSEATGSTFQFVNITKPGVGWKNNEHIVRSHVMRQVRKNKRCQNAKLKKKKPKNTPVSQQVTEDTIVEEQTRHFQLYQQPAAQQLSPRQSHLLSHVLRLYSPLLGSLSQKFVIWTKGVKEFMAIAQSHQYAMHAVLAWSATHLAEMTGDTLIRQDAYYHRAQALEGLQKAIVSFSKENADAVLCASIVMSWQAPDAGTWATLMRGAESVKATMLRWNYQSTLENHTAERSLMHSTNLFGNFIQINPEAISPQPLFFRDTLIEHAKGSLKRLQAFADTAVDLSSPIGELVTVIENLQNASPDSSPQTRLERTQPLRDLLFWFPTRFIPILNTHPAIMLLMAHIHAVALFIEPVTNADSAYFRSLNIGPIEAFCEEFKLRDEIKKLSGEMDGVYQTALSLMAFPLEAVADFRARLGFVADAEAPEMLVGDISRNLEKGKGHTCKHKTSVLRVLENFPVGLWHHSLL